MTPGFLPFPIDCSFLTAAWDSMKGIHSTAVILGGAGNFASHFCFFYLSFWFFIFIYFLLLPT